MKFYVAVNGSKGEHYKEVEGKKIVIPGFENFGFFQHKDKSNYVISETTTGLSVAGGKTLKQVMERAVAIFKVHTKKGERELEEIIENARKAGHVSPLYKANFKKPQESIEPAKEPKAEKSKEKKEEKKVEGKEETRQESKKMVKSNKVYQVVVGNVLQEIENNNLQWNPMRKIDGMNMPYNIVSKRPYTGINRVLTYFAALMNGDWRFLTFNQINSKGGEIKKDVKGTPILFYKKKDICYRCFNRDDCDEETKKQACRNYRKTDEENCPEFIEDEKVYPLMSRFYTIYNIQQTTLEDDIEVINASENEATDNFKSIKAFLLGTGAVFKKGMKPYYNLTNDTIFIPDKKGYDDISVFYHDIFHELTHWTGKEDRLNRPSLRVLPKDETESEIDETEETQAGKYAFEELTAELGSLFLCMKFGVIEENIFNNTVAYLKSWLKRLRDDPSLLVKASTQAEKAVSYLENLQREQKVA